MESHFLQKLALIGLLFSCNPIAEKPSFLDPEMVRNGDLIFRYGNGVFSRYFVQMSDSNQNYSHVGIVHRSADSLYVIHSEASELTLVGHVRRDRLDDFLKNARRWGLYRLNRRDSLRNEVVDVALKYVEKKVPFDMDFSLEDDQRIYCTELVALSVNAGLDEPLMEPSTKVMGKVGFAIDDILLTEGVKLVVSSDDIK